MKMKIIRIISFTDAGYALAGQLCSAFSLRGEKADAVLCSGSTGVSLREWTEQSFRKDRVLVFVGACGIAVRAVAPFLRNKAEDPAVLVMDEKGAFCIPVLSGHLGEANKYAVLAAGFTGGTPVLTTATDVNRLFPVDVFASENGLTIVSMDGVKHFSAGLLKSGKGTMVIPGIFSGEIRPEGPVPPEITVRSSFTGSEAECLISPELFSNKADSRMTKSAEKTLQLIPRCLILGIGCRKGRSTDQLAEFTAALFADAGLDLRALRCIASVDLKKEEAGLLGLAERLGVPFVTYSPEELMKAEGSFSSSEFVCRTTGADNVCERAAVSAGAVRLLIGKTVRDGMTAAVGIADTVLRFPEPALLDEREGSGAERRQE